MSHNFYLNFLFYTIGAKLTKKFYSFERVLIKVLKIINEIKKFHFKVVKAETLRCAQSDGRASTLSMYFLPSFVLGRYLFLVVLKRAFFLLRLPEPSSQRTSYWKGHEVFFLTFLPVWGRKWMRS